MKLKSSDFEEFNVMPEKCAFLTRDSRGDPQRGQNQNPALSWTGVPAATKWLAIVCDDLDVPQGLPTLNVPPPIRLNMPRRSLYHRVVIDIDPIRPIKSAEFTVRKAAKASTSSAAREGLNDYTIWFADDKKMRGEYFGYGGPAPPHTDETPHRYQFTLFALDVRHLQLADRFTREDFLSAARGHVLQQAQLIGLYAGNVSAYKNPTL
jgi:Raf kinase inhibitor-like YbhB/YbcL family protein